MLNFTELPPSLAYALSAGPTNSFLSGEGRNLDQLASAAAEVHSLIPAKRFSLETFRKFLTGSNGSNVSNDSNDSNGKSVTCSKTGHGPKADSHCYPALMLTPSAH